MSTGFNVNRICQQNLMSTECQERAINLLVITLQRGNALAMFNVNPCEPIRVNCFQETLSFQVPERCSDF